MKMSMDSPIPTAVQQVGEFLDVSWEIKFLQFSSDSQYLAATTDGGPIQMWDRRTSEKQELSPLLRKERVASLHIIKDVCIATSYIPFMGYMMRQGQRISDSDGIVYVRRSDQASVLRLMHEAAPSGAMCSQNGQIIVTTDMARTIRVWHAQTGHLLAAHNWEGGTQGESSRNIFAISPDDQFLALCCDKKRHVLQIWRLDPRTHQMQSVASRDDVPFISILTMTDDGQHVIAAVGGFPATALHIYTVPTLTLVERIPLPVESSPQMAILSFSASARHACVALLLRDARVWIWHRPSQQYLFSFQSYPFVHLPKAPYFNARTVAWSPDGAYLATGGFFPDAPHAPLNMFSVRLWQIEEAEKRF